MKDDRANFASCISDLEGLNEFQHIPSLYLPGRFAVFWYFAADQVLFLRSAADQERQGCLYAK